MILLGNIFLGLAALVFWALFNMMFLKTPPRGGDAVVGYAWALIFGVLAFSICLSIVTAVIGKLGGFAWSEGNAKTALVVTWKWKSRKANPGGRLGAVQSTVACPAASTVVGRKMRWFHRYW